jgi:uncharacterized membrane protein YphA (DoxX/SURF4 family)
VLIAARLVMAATFAVAGAAKLADRRGARRAVGDFGVPQFVAGPVGTALPLAELAIAIGLLPDASARWSALAALGLLAAFSTLMITNLARGRRPDCHCFGQVRSAPIGPWALARNVGLAGLAGVVYVSGPGPSVIGWVGDLPLSMWVVVGVALVAATVLCRDGSASS